MMAAMQPDELIQSTVGTPDEFDRILEALAERIDYPNHSGFHFRLSDEQASALVDHLNRKNIWVVHGDSQKLEYAARLRPGGVPDDAVPFVGWVARGGEATFDILTPNGEYSDCCNAEDLSHYGLPVPAAPAPSLPERLRDEARYLTQADGAGAPAVETRVQDLLREAADALEAGSQP